MDGMIDMTVWKTKCCNTDTEYYYASDYPYDSGKQCICCGQRWSELQIARGHHLKPSEPWARCKDKNKHKG